MDEAGNTKDDLSLPKGTDDAEKLAQQIQEDFDAGKELVVTVLKVRSRKKDSAGCIWMDIICPGPGALHMQVKVANKTCLYQVASGPCPVWSCLELSNRQL